MWNLQKHAVTTVITVTTVTTKLEAFVKLIPLYCTANCVLGHAKMVTLCPMLA